MLATTFSIVTVDEWLGGAALVIYILSALFRKAA